MPSAAAQLSSWTPMATARRMLSSSFDALRRFALVAWEFIKGDTHEEVGEACLRCSSSSPTVRAFILNEKRLDGWRFLFETTKEHQGANTPSPQGSIVIHAEGEECPRVRVGQCDTCGPVDLDPITDECPSEGVNHRVFNKHAKPRRPSNHSTGGDAGTPQQEIQ
ncbi:MAG TPA: hypothetical protein VLC46_16535 [Thermoanaerobaculia bacterium]|jgi:hypothetical protein|nr:hypothetical protein [Thermoanaerobaculia bacterium]